MILKHRHFHSTFQVVKVVVPGRYLDNNTKYHIQPSGNFTIGGPQVRIFFAIAMYNTEIIDDQSNFVYQYLPSHGCLVLNDGTDNLANIKVFATETSNFTL